MRMANNPLPYQRMPEIVSCIRRVNDPLAESNAKAACTTKPAFFTLANQCASLDITSSAIDYIASTN